MKNKQKLWIVRGAPGSGKSTKAREIIKENLGTLHFEADMFFYDKDGNYHFDARDLPHAHKWCEDMVKKTIRDGRSTVVSNTFTKKWEYEKYINIAEDAGIPYEIIVMTGEYDNIHGVPSVVVERMKREFEI